jgi:hypothetical protein
VRTFSKIEVRSSIHTASQNFRPSGGRSLLPGSRSARSLPRPALEIQEFRKFVQSLRKGEREARQAKRARGGEPPARHLHCEKYTKRGVQFLDLIQERNIGLMKAVDKYEYRRAYWFSNYGTRWVRPAVTRSMRKPFAFPYTDRGHVRYIITTRPRMYALGLGRDKCRFLANTVAAPA